MRRAALFLLTLLAGLCTAQERQLVTVWGISATADDKGTDAVVRAFEAKYPQYKVRMLGMGAGGMNPQKLMTAIVGNAAPDVIKQDRFSLSDWASRGAFQPLDAFIARDHADPYCPKKEDYFDAPWQEAVYDGRVYGVPLGADDRILYWNKKYFRSHAQQLKDAGLDPERPPRTWTEYLAYSKALTDYNPDGSIKSVGGMPNFGNTWLYMYSIQNLGSFISTDGKRATFSSPENLEALETMLKGYAQLGGRDKTRAFENTLRQGENNAFLLEQVAMQVTGDWELESYLRYKPKMEFGTAPPPVPDDRFYGRGRFKGVSPLNSWIGGFAYAIPTGAKNTEGGWKFLSFATSLEARTIEFEAQADLARSKGRRYMPRMPAQRGAAKLLVDRFANQNTPFDEALRNHVAALEYSQCRGSTFAAQAVWDAQARAFQEAVDERKTAKEALEEADRTVQPILDEFYAMHDKPVADTQTPMGVAWAIGLAVAVAFVVWVLRSLKGRVAQQEALAGYLFISPWIIGFLVFTVGPMIVSLYLSFTVYNVLSPPRWLGPQNYVDLFTRDWPHMSQTLYNVAYIGLIGIPLGNAAGLAVAMLLNTGVRGMRVYRTFFYLPAVLPAVAGVVLWMWLLNPSPDVGIVNMVWRETIQKWFDVRPPAWHMAAEWAKPTLIFMGLWGAGSGMMLWLAGLKGVPSSLYEAASLDGASKVQQFWKVTVPQLTPLIFFNLIMSIIGTVQTFDNVFILTAAGGGPGDSLLMPVLWLFNQGFTYFRMGYASAMAWMLFGIVLVLTFANLWGGKFWVHSEARD